MTDSQFMIHVDLAEQIRFLNAYWTDSSSSSSNRDSAFVYTTIYLRYLLLYRSYCLVYKPVTPITAAWCVMVVTADFSYRT